ncbi:MAG TPA: DUF4234 domain-containing protein [Planctomycetota bacterium]|jgi:uncharacterized protein DUF4234|nr:DUF4234 domain-containing protein [Planctomycetota bacterium]
MADTSAGGAKGKVENSVMQAVITLVCGIYGLYWLWLRADEINAYFGKPIINKMLIFPGCFACGIPPIIAMFYLCKATADAESKAGTSTKDDSILYFILMFLLFPVGVWMVQEKLNAVWQK